MSSNNIVIIHLILLLMLFGLTLSLKCYICHTNDNRLCTNETLMDCPDNQAYDRCMTRIFKNPEDGLHIKKECALAPCHLRDPKLEFISFTDQCKNTQDCIHCCNTDGCNTDGVSDTSAYKILTLMIGSVGVFIHFCHTSFTLN